jgi:DNA repair ATPase RecN
MRTILKRVSATGGYLEHSPVTFTEGLNCIIGARGTCKSTLVESIRFVYDAEPDRIKALLDDHQEGNFTGMIKVTLEGGSLRCETLDLEDETSYNLERDVQSEPRIYREGVKDHTDTRLLHQIEIYSQGDLQRIAEDPPLRLKLIDRPNMMAIEDLRRERKKYANQLRELGPQIRDHRAHAEQRRAQVRALPELQVQLDDVRSSRPSLSQELNQQRELYLKRKVVLDALRRLDEAREAGAEALLSAAPYLSDMRAALTQIDEQAMAESTEAARSATALVDELTASLEAARKMKDSHLAAATAELGGTFEKLNEPYYELRKQEQEANESLKKEDELKRQIGHLQNAVDDLASIEERLNRLIGERVRLRQNLHRLGSDIYKLRETEVRAINKRHGDLVVLTLEHNSLSKEYLDSVQSLLKGSRLRDQDEIAREIAAKLPPEDLVDLVEAGDTKGLSEVMGRDNVQMTRLMSFLIDSPRLYELEGHIFEDRLNITMFDEGVPKPVNTLSNGQKATALLPLILREASYPLVFDQPEDDLDNRFIFTSLVQHVRDLKQRRQIIFVTHNANIPVIGEAENVVVMRMDTPSRAGAPLQGSVDERQLEIVDLLEGGAEAFLERERHYHDLLGERGRGDA